MERKGRKFRKKDGLYQPKAVACECSAKTGGPRVGNSHMFGYRGLARCMVPRIASDSPLMHHKKTHIVKQSIRGTRETYEKSVRKCCSH